MDVVVDFAHWIRNHIVKPVREVRRLGKMPWRQEDVVGRRQRRQ
jgi:hypothetical protein